MSIRAKVALAIAVAVILSVGAVFMISEAMVLSMIDTAADEAIHDASAQFDALEAADIEKLQAVSTVLQTRIDLQELYLAGDRDALNEAAKPLFEQLKEQYSITHMYFIDSPPGSKVFLRVHKPEKFDDQNMRDTYVASVGSESWGAGKDLGKTAFALRVVHPWYDTGGQIVGYIEVGQEIEEFLDIMSERSGDEVALLLKKDAVDGEEWAVMRDNRDQENNWDEDDEFVLAHATDEELDGSDFGDLSIDDLQIDGNSYSSGTEDDLDLIVGAFPVENTMGEVVGAVVVEHDITEEIAGFRDLRMRVALLLAAMGALLLLAVIFMLNTLVFKRLDTMTAHMEDATVRLAGGDFDLDMPNVTSSDEIGRFEKFFGEFLGAVANTLKQLSGK